MVARNLAFDVAVDFDAPGVADLPFEGGIGAYDQYARTIVHCSVPSRSKSPEISVRNKPASWPRRVRMMVEVNAAIRRAT
jgi:hypothetical protein